jgi:hypothetical protein
MAFCRRNKPANQDAIEWQAVLSIEEGSHVCPARESVAFGPALQVGVEFLRVKGPDFVRLDQDWAGVMANGFTQQAAVFGPHTGIKL